MNCVKCVWCTKLHTAPSLMWATSDRHDRPKEPRPLTRHLCYHDYDGLYEHEITKWRICRGFKLDPDKALLAMAEGEEP